MSNGFMKMFIGVEGRRGVSAAGVDTLLFDVDGVLIDVSGSFRMTIISVVRFYLEHVLGWSDGNLLKVEDTELFKKAGGFNDDWDLTCAVVLFFLYKEVLAGSRDRDKLLSSKPLLQDYTMAIRNSPLEGLDAAVALVLEGLPKAAADKVMLSWHREEITRIFQETYAGADLCEEIYGGYARYISSSGLIRTERPLLNNDLPAGTGCRLGIITGRTKGEMKVGLGLLNAERLFPESSIMTAEDGKKPDPMVISTMMERLGAKRAVYVGDTYDDLRTVLHYRAGGRSNCLFCAVLTGPSGDGNKEFFRSEGADLIADDVNAFLAMMKEVRDSA
ncbi:MAG: HAD family hydrolase [bacterium]|jgi:HAD superfamily phosphatase|nr:HAD-IA family hydrolase [bacterium]